MGKEKNKFNALTPEVLNENKQIYTEALDYAFGNSDIKNIAITGIYGAGKSTVWKTYEKERKLKNIITVSLGKYEDDFESDNKEQNVESKIENNRIERQIINQILSQVNSKNIPLSKYAFKKNKDAISIWKNILPIISFLLSIGIWLSKDVLSPSLNSYSIGIGKITLISTALILCPILYWAYKFFAYNRLHLSKINVKGAEANFNDIDYGDETILERDMKEIVYLLDCSDTEIVVFEDLDRYDNIEIFTKLRELNFLINSFLSTKDSKIKKTIRFVYMLRDGLFLSKNRTKFFDFIVPVVPVIDSKNSENKLNEAVKAATNVPDKKVIAKISLYIDDMRLLKNIVNEYLVYENVIAIQELKLDANKLLALIVLKNIFPREFDLLQEDKGYIHNIFENSKNYKVKVKGVLNEQLKKVSDELAFLNSRDENSKFEAMASMISPNVCIYEYDNNSSWAEFLKDKSLNPDSSFRISYVNTGNNSTWDDFNYKTFVEKFILTTQERKDKVKHLPENRQSRIQELLQEKKTLEKQMREISLYSVKDQLKILKASEVDQIFIETEDKITQNHYFRLIRFLVMQGLIDETYWHYKGCFYQGSLGKNDTIFIKNLSESKSQDNFLDLENPMEVKSRLDMDDFQRFNILNKKLLEACIISESEDELVAIISSVRENDNYELLMPILDAYEYKVIKKFVNLMLEKDAEVLVEILEESMSKSSITFCNLLMSICTKVYTKIDTLKLFTLYIEKNENVISLISDDEFEVFISNISLVEIKFYDIAESEASTERIKRIENVQTYRLSVKNVRYITETILGEKCDYGNLVSVIFTSNLLESTKEYLESNFVEFIEQYIDENIMDEQYRNNEDIIVKIMNSNLSKEYKLKYIEQNETIVSDISKIEELEQNIYLIEALIARNKMLFNLDNINNYWKSIDEYDEEFINYFDQNVNDDNYEEIFSGNTSISNSFINSSIVSDKVFEYALKCAKKQIDNIDEATNRERTMKLINKNLVSLTIENLKVLLNNKFYQEIVILVNTQSAEQQDDAVAMILDLAIVPELIYKLVNSNISDENAKKLVSVIIDEVLIEEIDFDKVSIIEYLIEQGLSDVNINYICKNFKSFKLKDKFIEYLDTNNKFSKINAENIDPTFSQLIFSRADVSIDSKINLTLIKIKSNANKDELVDIFSRIDDIAELADVWNNKRPALDNIYKEQVGEALINFGYVSRRNDRNCVRIMERKKAKFECVRKSL